MNHLVVHHERAVAGHATSPANSNVAELRLQLADGVAVGTAQEAVPHPRGQVMQTLLHIVGREGEGGSDPAGCQDGDHQTDAVNPNPGLTYPVAVGRAMPAPGLGLSEPTALWSPDAHWTPSTAGLATGM